MQNSVAQRSTILFEESIKSKYTKKNYAGHMIQFERFSGLDKPQILMIPPEKLQEIVEDYLIDLKRTANPNSIPSKFQGIRHFCIMNRIRLDWDIIHKMFPPRQKTPNLRAYTTQEIYKMISNAKNIRDAALVGFLASTGARIGAFDHQLTVDHMQRMPHGCIAVKIYAGHLEEYWTFLTPQTSRLLKKYHDHRKNRGEIFSDDTPVFVAGNTTAQLGWSGARTAIYRTISRSGVSRSKHNGRYDVQADHGFRKRFNTILKLNHSVNYNVAEKLMGHKNGLDGIYFTPTLHEMFAEFKKIISKLEVQIQ